MKRCKGLIRTMILGAACLLAGPVNGIRAGDTPDALLQAREAIEKQDYDGAISRLSALSGEAAETADFHYLMGLAVFRKTEGAVEALREKQEQSPDGLTEDQAAAYREALDHFRRVVALEPQGPDTPEAHYLAALLLDYGYLQRFGEFGPEYRKVLDSYPDTEAARKARERLKYHGQLFRHFGTEEKKNPAPPAP